MNKPLISGIAAVALASGIALAAPMSVAQAPIAACNTFSDVPPAYCSFVLELSYLGIAAGTTPTTFSPDQPLTRGQATVFVSKAIDTAIQRSSRRAALGQWWTSSTGYDAGMGFTPVGNSPGLIQSDGVDLWIANQGDGTVSCVRASDGAVLGTWTGAPGAFGVLVAWGRVFVTGQLSPGALYMIDPTQPPGPVTVVASNLGDGPMGIAFDGHRIWTANFSNGTSGGSVSITSPMGFPTPPPPPLPWPVTTVTVGLAAPGGIVFDGNSMWVTEAAEGTFKRLNGGGAVNLTVPVGTSSAPTFPVFDGANLWVPTSAGVSVIRASTGGILTTLTGNGLDNPISAGFDGQRVLVTNPFAGLPRVSLFKAADLSDIENVPALTFGPPLGFTRPFGVCSDGINFWITLRGTPGGVGRF